MNKISLGYGSLNTVKWLALLLMIADHTNKYLFNGTLPMAFEAGRLCLPLFALVLAYNLSAPGSLQSGVHVRVIKRLVSFGILSSFPFIALGGLVSGWWPLNVLFTLAVIASVIFYLDGNMPHHKILAAVIFAVGGAMVEFWWPAILLGVASWYFFRSPSWCSMGFVILAFAGLSIINRNAWALAALPLFFFIARLRVNAPRAQWFFYSFYPFHLALIWAIRIPMRSAGYLFF